LDLELLDGDHLINGLRNIDTLDILGESTLFQAREGQDIFHVEQQELTGRLADGQAASLSLGYSTVNFRI